MSLLLGIDIGSSSAKVGLFRLDGHPVAIVTRYYPTLTSLPDYKEQDPEKWWLAVVDALEEIRANLSLDQVISVGTTGHISSLTFVDDDGKPIRPSIGFQDRRAVAELQELYDLKTREELASILGIDLPPSPTWPLPRLLWLRRHEPRTLESTRRILQAKDFVNLRLTGEFATDASSNRGMVDLNTGVPVRQLFLQLGLPPDLLPKILHPTQVIGTISTSAALITGLPAGIPVAVGWNDLNACILGSGSVSPRDLFNITGTSDHLGLITDRPCCHQDLVYAPFLPQRNLLYGVTSAGGGSLQWYSRAFQLEIPELLREAASAPACSESLLFLPYLEGERAPIWDMQASGAFIGIRTVHQQSHFARSILEGVAFSLAQILELVRATEKISNGPIIISGGASVSGLWNQIKSDIFDLPVATPEVIQTGVLGAAMLSAVAITHYDTCTAAAKAMVRLGIQLCPRQTHAARYREMFLNFCELYPSLKTVLSRIHADRTNHQFEGEHSAV